MAKKPKTVMMEVPEDWASAVKEFLGEVEGATPDTSGGGAVDYAAFERAVEQSTAKLEMTAHRRVLQGLDIDAQRVIIGEKPHTRVGRYEATVSRGWQEECADG